jgi:1-aminocyclopropane-1-carboxylate deaminase
MNNKIIHQQIKSKITVNAGIKLYMARADTLHPLASGNKIYKLRPNLDYAKANNISRILSFGGAYSNHLHALALMAKVYGFESTAIIRGESDYANNPTLRGVQAAGMQLEFVNRLEYRKRNEEAYLVELQKRYPNTLIIPEGGSSQLAISGCAQLARDVNMTHQSDIIAISCGTGATLAGIVCGLAENQKAIGYAVLIDQSLEERVATFITAEKSTNIQFSIENADFGGYAKLDKKLLDFILDWLEKTGILLDPVYTSKMCMRLMQQIEAGEFQQDTSITMIHSGGLQGWRGMKNRVVEIAGEAVWAKIFSNINNN